MRKVREVLRLKHTLGMSYRQISEATGVGKTVVGEYVRRAGVIGITWPVPEAIDDAELAHAEVIDLAKQSGDVIRFGATVTVVDEDSQAKKTWQLVGEPEADAHRGRISVMSPIGRALIGKNRGDSVEVKAPAGTRSYKVQKIEWKDGLRP